MLEPVENWRNETAVPRNLTFLKLQYEMMHGGIRQMEKKDVKNTAAIKRISPLDISILRGLYDYRALSTDQVQRRYNLTLRYTYRKLRILRVSGYIESCSISHYRVEQASQGKYYRLTSKGIKVLKESEMFIDKQVHQLVVSKYYIPFLLAANDLLVDLEPYGWMLMDSRDTKAHMGINRSDNIHGVLKNKHTGNQEYGIYIFLDGVSEKNLEKMVRELKNYAIAKQEGNCVRVTDYIIFKRGQDGFDAIITKLMHPENRVILSRIRSLKVLPYTFGKYYLRAFEQEEEVLRFACSIPENELSYEVSFVHHEVNAKYTGLQRVILHQGEEKYFINLLDNDLRKIYDIYQYTSVA